ncbi:MAG: PDZ domain-containing protein [Planctomycetota bacterium]
MLTLIAAAVLVAPQDASLDRVPFAVSESAPKQLQIVAPAASDDAFLGVGFATGSDGARIQFVQPGTAAERAGLAAGDVLVRVGGTDVATADAARDAISTRRAGDRVTIEWTRDGKSMSKEVELGSRASIARTPATPGAPAISFGLAPSAPAAPAAPAAPVDPGPGRLGVTIQTVDGGVLVQDVEDGGPADRAGLVAGDIVVKIAGEDATGADRVVEILGGTKAGQSVPVRVRRADGNEQRITVQLGGREGAAAPRRMGGLFLGGEGPADLGDLEVELEDLGMDFGDFEQLAPGVFRFESTPAPGGDRGDRAERRDDFRQRLREMRQRHRDELRALRDEFGMGADEDLFPDVDFLFQGEDAPQLFRRAAPQGGAAPRGRAPLAPAAPGAPRVPALPAVPSLPQNLFVTPGDSHGVMIRSSVETTPDGRTVTKTLRGELVDGEWKWTEEATTDEDGTKTAPPVRMQLAPVDSLHQERTELDHAIEDLRKQLEQLEKRNAELMQKMSSRAGGARPRTANSERHPGGSARTACRCDDERAGAEHPPRSRLAAGSRRSRRPRTRPRRRGRGSTP